jgi:hypothetical protein
MTHLSQSEFETKIQPLQETNITNEEKLLHETRLSLLKAINHDPLLAEQYFISIAKLPSRIIRKILLKEFYKIESDLTFFFNDVNIIEYLILTEQKNLMLSLLITINNIPDAFTGLHKSRDIIADTLVNKIKSNPAQNLYLIGTLNDESNSLGSLFKMENDELMEQTIKRIEKIPGIRKQGLNGDTYSFHKEPQQPNMLQKMFSNFW